MVPLAIPTGTHGESDYISPWAVKCKERMQDLLTKQKGQGQKIEYGAYIHECGCVGSLLYWELPRESLFRVAAVKSNQEYVYYTYSDSVTQYCVHYGKYAYLYSDSAVLCAVCKICKLWKHAYSQPAMLIICSS